MFANIRNFVIIAHIDHGKSTLADRLLELTGTIEKRKMREQYLDSMDLERERGITIKMQPVRMSYILNSKSYILNLIDTPGHVDFSYEVSRSLAAVEGAILLVDATKGVEAQTLANFELAKRQGLVIIPAINKIDLLQAKIEEISQELERLTGGGDIIRVSAKTGENVGDILTAITERVSPPKGDVEKSLKALIFDSQYDSYKGIIVHVRIFDGEIRSGEKIKFLASGVESETLEVGIFSPKLEAKSSLAAGEIGYIATGLKDIEKCRIGDTITLANLHKYTTNNTNAIREIGGKFAHISDIQPLAGYKEPKPMVFASVFPENGDDFDLFKDGINKLKLNDSSLAFEPEQSVGLGRGLRCGFLGMLHMDIILERLKREYKLDLVVSSPSVEYKITDKNSGEAKFARSAAEVEDISGTKIIEEPWVKVEIITPSQYLGAVMELLEKSRGLYQDTRYLSQNTILLGYEAPLADIIIDFYDQLKNVSSGYASMNYEFMGHRVGDLVRLDILVAGEKFDAFSRIVPRVQSYYEARKIVKKLKEILPKQLFEVSIQAAIGGKIVARETIRALKKDVTGYLYGGDITRKKKLWEKQKRGKKRMKTMGRVDIPPEVFRELLKK